MFRAVAFWVISALIAVLQAGCGDLSHPQPRPMSLRALVPSPAAKTEAEALRPLLDQSWDELRQLDALRGLLEQARDELNAELNVELNADGFKNRDTLVKASDGAVCRLAFFPDGSRFIAVTGTLQVWDAKSRTRIAEQKLKGHWDIDCIALSPDGKTLAVANEKNVEVWDVETWQLRQTLPAHPEPVRNLVFSPSGDLLACGSVGALRVWKASDWTRLQEWDAGGLMDLAFSPDGKHLAAAVVNKWFVIWDVATGQRVTAPDYRSTYATCIAYSANGRLLAVGGMDPAIYVWDANCNKLLKTLQGHHGIVGSLVFSADSKYLFSTAQDGTVRVWPLEDGQSGPPLWGHIGWVRCSGLALGGTVLVTGDSSGNLRFWDTAEIIERPEKYHTLGAERRVFFPHTDAKATTTAVAPDGKTLATIGTDAEKTTVKFWDTETLQLRKTLEDDLATGPPQFSADGKVLAYATGYRSTVDGKDRHLVGVVLVDVATLETHSLLEGVESASFCFPRSGKTVLTATGKEVVLWDLASRKKIQELSIDEGEIRSVAAFPDARRIATGDSRNGVKIWDLPRKKLQHTLQGHTQGVNGLRLTPDGRWLLSFSFSEQSKDTEIRIWDTEKGTQASTVNPKCSTSNLALTQDGKTLAYSHGTRIILWDLEGGKTTHVLRGHLPVTGIKSMSLAHDVPVLVTSGNDGSVRIWDLP